MRLLPACPWPAALQRGRGRGGVEEGRERRKSARNLPLFFGGPAVLRRPAGALSRGRAPGQGLCWVSAAPQQHRLPSSPPPNGWGEGGGGGGGWFLIVTVTQSAEADMPLIAAKMVSVFFPPAN